jgi:hypothetical protein
MVDPDVAVQHRLPVFYNGYVAAIILWFACGIKLGLKLINAEGKAQVIAYVSIRQGRLFQNRPLRQVNAGSEPAQGAGYPGNIENNDTKMHNIDTETG